MRENTLDEKTAIVTGAAKGIGKGIATVFAEEGAQVAVVDVDAEQGNKTAEQLREKGGEATFIEADVSREDQVKEIVEKSVEKYGPVEILVNNAGIGVYKSVLETSSEDWDRCLEVNLKGVFLCSKYSIPYMQEVGGGSIINLSSVHAFATANETSPYAASKGGIAALTRSLAIDYASDGIRVNAICPGWILTPLIRSIFESADNPEKMQQEVTERQLLGRLGTPEDVGKAARYLASEEASFVTGSMQFVDGGLMAQLETW
ncbi:glucose 1-dehydrogenase [Candidatus Bipolaricaulota bacterium]|nr:glucose 1-dehydrogenase [Candidatus Bipolaricaulota bacterium]